MNLIELDRATIGVGGRPVLSEITLSISAGEFVGVLGPNGSGKTTLMRALLGLIRPSAGSVRVFGRPAERGNPVIGYVPQLRTVLPNLRIRGFDVIASSMNGERWGLPALTATHRRIIGETLATTGARDLAQRPLSEMSGGERQRLLLAQALIGGPRLLLLDEPLIGLDANHQDVAIDFIRRFSRECGIAVLFSAHELNQLLDVLDRVLYLGRGRAALGTVEEVVTAPVLSRLYGTEIDVIHADGHIFVMSKGRHAEQVVHLHEQNHAHNQQQHDHGHVSI
jgi:zinc/manganese transport system ATP-binding protein